MPPDALISLQNAYGIRAPPGHTGGAHSTLPDPLAVFKGSYCPTSKEKGGGMRQILYPDFGWQKPLAVAIPKDTASLYLYQT